MLVSLQYYILLTTTETRSKSDVLQDQHQLQYYILLTTTETQSTA